jgi:hypothetical protein
MTTPQLTGWIKGQPLKSRPGFYEAAVAVRPLTGRHTYLMAKQRVFWTGSKWDAPSWMHYTHFRGLAKKA